MMLTLRTEPEPTEPTDPTDPDDGARWGESWLEPMVASRAEIHQATGMVLAALNIPAADALARIRAYAFLTQRLLIDVAHDIVTRRLELTDDDPA